MQVILLENIKSLGKIGDIVKVKRGYARNYLIKFEKALDASKENIEIVKQ
jgi:large subunit ribosomal protein L9